MSNRPKPKSKIQYGTPAPGAPGSPKRPGEGGPMGAKIAIGAAIAVVLVAVIVFAVKDGGGDNQNKVAFQPATVTGATLPNLPDDGSADPAVGQQIPTVVGKSFDGSKVEIKGGEPQLIAFIAHWCRHCQAEVPLIAGWQADDSLGDIKITGVSTAADETRGNFPPASWLEKESWKNETLVDDPTSKVLNAFGATSFPTIVAVKADGTVALRLTGELTLDQVKQLVDAAEGKEVAPVDSTTDTTPLTSPAPTTTVAP